MTSPTNPPLIAKLRRHRLWFAGAGVAGVALATAWAVDTQPSNALMRPAAVSEPDGAFRPSETQWSGLRFETAIPETTVPVRADRDAVSQIIVNLISNAEKYSNGAKEIRLELEQHGSTAELRVLDRGPGVPRGCAEKIFEKFYRANDSLTNNVPGSGLGLTLARQIARAHDGDVIYEPREGGGSCFTLKLPVTVPST